MAWPPRFIFIGGALTLDFTQTGGEGWRSRWEGWHTPDDLADWAAAAPWLGFRPAVDQADLAAARALRETLWTIASDQAQGQAPRPADMALIEAWAKKPDPVPVWRNGRQAFEDGQPFAQVLSAVARDTISLFGTERVQRFRKCANPNCYLMFVDTSRPGKRAWCTMDRCGNLMKAARHRAKTKGDDHVH